MPDDAPGLVRLADYAPPAFAVDSVSLDLWLDPERTVVSSRLSLRRALGGDADAPLRLDGVELDLLSITLDGEPVSANRLTIDADGLTLADVPGAFTLQIEVAIHPRRNPSRLGLFEIGGQLATQCEAQGFRRITYWPDRPDVLATWEVTLHADRATCPVLLSNGDPVASGDEPGGRHFALWRDPYPKPSYLFAVVAGDLDRLEDRFVTAGGREVALAIYADAGLIPQCRFAMDAIKRSMAWDETAYGRQYDLDVFNVVALSGWSGAMENKGLNLFGAAGIITDPDISTDDDYIIIERIVAHEQFHNWTGNRVTCRDWFQLCLKEGLTRFRDQQFIEDKMSSGVWRIESVKALRRNQFAEDDGPAAHPVKPDAYAAIENFYTNTVYDKGAEVVRMLRALIGPEAFRRGMDLYFARHDGQAVTTEAFMAAMEAASRRDLTQFGLWHTQAGRPRVTVSGAYDAAARRYDLTLTQTCPPSAGQPEKAAFHIPLALGLVGRDGAPLSFSFDGAEAAEMAVIELRESRQVVSLQGVGAAPIPSLPRGFSAPVTIIADLADEDLAVLMASDPDPFARWDAGQTLAVRLIRALAGEVAAGRPMAPPQAFLQAIEATLTDEASDRLLLAQILTLPDEPVLSEGLARIDLDGHMAARAFLRREIAGRFEVRLRKLYEANAETGPYVPDIAGIGRRRLKNTVLDLLTALDTPEIAALCLSQTTGAGNMTDSFEALCLLTHMNHPQRDQALDWFHDRWKDRPTVIEKWFNAQALSRAPGAVDRIIALEGHPSFDPGDFSQSLQYYGGFFRQNRVAFHDPSGRGYDFLADRLLMIDRLGRSGSHYIMPQINQWRRYDPHRQALMLAALRRVAMEPGISRSLRENVNKALS